MRGELMLFRTNMDKGECLLTEGRMPLRKYHKVLYPTNKELALSRTSTDTGLSLMSEEPVLYLIEGLILSLTRGDMGLSLMNEQVLYPSIEVLFQKIRDMEQFPMKWDMEQFPMKWDMEQFPMNKEMVLSLTK
jgi:hypothetical protein